MSLYDDHSSDKTAPPPDATPAVVKDVIDPKLIEKALKKMQGIVRGNGIRVEDVSLSDAPDAIQIKMYRFRARTFLKLVTEASTKTEPGKKPKIEVVATQNDFQQAVAKTIITARTDPHQRKIITDMMATRPDKGFGIDQQKLRIPQLARNLVLHEKCVSCNNTGKTLCPKCHGHKTLLCINCHGRKQITCPRCRGTSRIIVNGKQQPCTHCRSDGKINCPKCMAHGQVKCQPCAGTGSIKCQPCAGTGWLSHVTHIEVFAKTYFDYDRIVLPDRVVALLEKHNAQCVIKHDIEVTLKDGWMEQNRTARGDTSQNAPQRAIDTEPDDTIWLDYEALCPYGPVTYTLKGKILSANLFGFQANLLDCPPFLDTLTRIGQQALMESAKGGKTLIDNLRKAARYAILRDIITQTVRLKNTEKTEHFLMTKYVAGFRREKFRALIEATDKSIAHITRMGRMMGVIIGMVLFAGLSALYYLVGEREFLGLHGIPEVALWVMDIALIPIGVLFGVYGGKLSAMVSQRKAFETIVPVEILSRTLPKAGKTLWWSLAGTLIITVMILVGGITTEQPLPSWLSLMIGR